MTQRNKTLEQGEFEKNIQGISKEINICKVVHK